MEGEKKKVFKRKNSKEIKSIWEKVTNIEDRQWRSNIQTIGIFEAENQGKTNENRKNTETINQENPQ